MTSSTAARGCSPSASSPRGKDRGLLRVTDDPEEAVRIMLDCFIEAEMKREAAPHNLATPLDIPNRPT